MIPDENPAFEPDPPIAWIPGHAKALVAVLASIIGSLVVATQDGSGVSMNEWLVAIAAALVTFGAVFGVANRT